MKHSTPIEILENLADIGVSKTNCTLRKLILMGIMAGAYIAFAGVASTMGAFNLLAEADTYGLGRILCGAIFTGGLVIVTLAGAELFTGNTLITISVLEKKTTVAKMLKNWIIVYISNFAGSVLIAWLVYNSGVLSSGDGLLGAMTIKIASGEVFTMLSGAPADALEHLDWAGMFVNNLLPVTLGNVIGGMLMVAFGYWFSLKSKN